MLGRFFYCGVDIWINCDGLEYTYTRRHARTYMNVIEYDIDYPNYTEIHKITDATWWIFQVWFQKSSFDYVSIYAVFCS